MLQPWRSLSAGWLEEQREGRPLGMFSGSDAELAAVKAHVDCTLFLRLDVFLLTGLVVFVECGVSVTCSVGDDGACKWWLTRESGRMKLQWCRRARSANRCCADIQEGSPRKGSYLVVKRRVGKVYETAIAALSQQSLEVFVSLVLPGLGAGSDAETIVDIFSALGEGAFSSGAQCVCIPWSVCRCCRNLPRKSVLFVWAEHFSELLWGTQVAPWFGGVTDAVGLVDGDGRMWMSCPLHGT